MSGLLIPSRDSSPSPALSREDVHVWFCRLARHDGRRAALAALLSRDEQTRAARFAFERDRHRFILSHGLLRAILARYVGREATQIEFATGAHGKPALSGQSCAVQDIQFSLSHSGAYAVVAVAAGRAVGVDVEVRTPDVDALKLAERFLRQGKRSRLFRHRGTRNSDCSIALGRRRRPISKGVGWGCLSGWIDSRSYSMTGRRSLMCG